MSFVSHRATKDMDPPPYIPATNRPTVLAEK
jgi:hypothetical protein